MLKNLSDKAEIKLHVGERLVDFKDASYLGVSGVIDVSQILPIPG